MQIHLITDSSDASIGMRFAGIDSTFAKDAQTLKDALKRATENKNIGIILITQGLYSENIELVDEFKKKITIPLITEIPELDKEFESDAITRYVSQAVGLG